MSAMIKCLVWDLDRTVWSGTLLEGDRVRLRPGVRRVIEELDRRGVLLSIASANDAEPALTRLERARLRPFFLHPQIGWESKVAGIRRIAETLNIGLPEVGFIDDEPYEREQVRQLLPEVRTYDARGVRRLLDRAEFHPTLRTRESRGRRRLYQQQEERARAEAVAGRSHRQFLRSCEMLLMLRPAAATDLGRILELMRRTHQLNATGIIYESDEIRRFLHDPEYRTYVAELKDRFADYGRIGVAVCLRTRRKWRLIAFLLSCRVLGRGIGGVFLNWVQCRARADGAGAIEAVYRKGSRNRRMGLLFRLAGFEVTRATKDGSVVMARRPVEELIVPEWLTVREGGGK